MHNLIVQNSFVKKLANNSDVDPVTADFADFISNDFFGYDLICDFKNFEEFYENIESNPLWDMINDKVNNVYYQPDLDSEVNHASFYNSLGLYNLFLVDLECSKCLDLRKKYGHLFLSIDNLDNEWDRFRVTRDIMTFKVTASLEIEEEKRFDSWDKLDKFSLPIKNVVIFDKYLLKDKSNQKLSDNLFPLLKKISNLNDRDYTIVVSIITEFKYPECIEAKYKSIKDFLMDNNITKFDVNIIKHDKNLYPSNFEGLHYRVILTDYFYFKSDDSFNYFKSNGRINNVADLYITNNLSNKHKSFYNKDINDLRKYVARLTNNPNNPDPNRKIVYYPNKANPLLN